MIHARTHWFLYAVSLTASLFSQGTEATLRLRTPMEIDLVSSTSSSTSPSPSATPMLSFQSFPPPTTCEATVFSWSYNGPNNPMLIQVSNVDVSQNSPPPSTTTSPTSTPRDLATTIDPRSAPSIPITPENVTITLTSNYSPQALSYIWNSVNVSQGWYILLGVIPTQQFVQASSPFFVRTGSNTSCLVGITSTTGTTLTHTPSPHPSSSSSHTSGTPIPASDLSPASPSKVPTIIGVSVGMAVLALFIGSIMVWCVFRRRRSRASGGNSKNNSQRWNRFNFSDTQADLGTIPTNKGYRSSRSHPASQPSSIAISIGTDFEDGIPGAEKNATQLNLKDLYFSDEQGVALSTLPVLRLSRTRPDHTHSASSSSSNLNDLGLPAVRSLGQHSSRPSISISSAVYPPSFAIESRELAQDVVTTPDSPHSPSTASAQHHDRASTYTLSTSPLSSFQFPPTPTFANKETKQMNRQSMGRKRKPVPVYDEEQQPTSPIFATNPPIPPFSNNRDSLAFPELSHKSSFGPGGIEGRQLHYLIPDMPMSVDR
jgi:hypothetical protein